MSTPNMLNTSGLSTRTNLYAEAKMLAYAGAQTVLDRFGEQYMMPKNKTDTVEMRRPVTFAAADTPLAEGVTPNPTAFRFENVRVQLKQYGQISTITDKIEDFHEDPVLNKIVEQLSDNVARTREKLMWGVLRAGTAVNYSNGTQRSDVNTKITLTKQRAVVQALKRQKAKPITRILAPSTNFKTSAIEASYIAVAHTDLEQDIRDLPGFVPCSQYGNRSMVSEYEIGSVETVRYVLTADLDPFRDAGGTAGTSVISTSGSAADVYPVVYLGQDAYMAVALRGQGAVEPSIIPVGQKTKDDPLGQRGIAGWKMYFAAVITNQNFMRRLEVSASNLA